MANFKILIIDDEINQSESIQGFLKKKGYDAITSNSGISALEIIKKSSIDLVLCDYRIGDITGKEVIEKSKEINPLLPIVIITAYGAIEDAVELMRIGAFDYLQKPIELSDLLSIIEKAEEKIALTSEKNDLKVKLEKRNVFNSIITNSPEMENALSSASRVAATKASVLIRGESGSGKELIARAIHYASDRNDKPFITINCGAIPENLLESELFGHEKGSFTGAIKQRIGKFELADKGDLFIDEVGDIPAASQVKLLRAIQFGEIERLGGNNKIKFDARIIAATNRNLEEMIKKGDFREDLYYRLNVVTIDIPPLRRRKTEIPPLFEFFIKKYAEENDKLIDGVSKEAMEALLKYDYPGNVRELENIAHRAVALSRGELITIKDLPAHIQKPGNISIAQSDDNSNEMLEIGDLNLKVENLEKILIKKALDKCGGNQTKAAEALNISERTLRYKLTKYGI